MATSSPTAVSGSAKSVRFYELDAIRGVAALAVVLSHFSSMISSDPLANVAWLNRAFGYFMLTPLGGMIIGLPAVLLFFILSGFALTKMLQGSQDSYSGYAIKRVARIWPPYLLSILLIVIFIGVFKWPTGEHVGGWVSKIVGHPLAVPDLIDHVLLLGAFDPHYNFVAWTLVYEMRISLLFPLIFLTLTRWSTKKSLGFYGALSLVSVILHYASKSQGHVALSNWVLTGHYMLFFALGGLLALNLKAILNWYVSKTNLNKFLLLLLAILSYTYPPQIRSIEGGFSKFPMVLTHWMILPGVTLMVIMAIASPGIKAWLMRPSLQWLGKVSYSLYLFHPLVLFLMVWLLSDSFGVIPAALLGIALSLVLAALAYQFAELPSQKMGRALAAALKSRKPLPG